MDGRRFAAVAALGFAILALGAGDASAAVFCGKVVTADLTVKRDLSNCPGDGLVIGANGVKIDLNGHTIDGTLAADSEGIYNNNYDGVVIKGGGRLTEFDTGVSYVSTVGGRIRGVTVKRALSPGINLQSADATQLTGSVIKGTHGAGVSVVHCVECRVTGNAIAGPATSTLSSYGITVSSTLSEDNLIRRNRIRAGAASDFGMLIFGSADHTRIRSNVIRGREIMSEGISVYNGATNTLVKDNISKSHIFNGIEIEDDAGAGSDVGGNVALNNGQWGILAAVAVTDLGGNKAAGNGQAGQCSGVVCTPP